MLMMLMCFIAAGTFAHCGEGAKLIVTGQLQAYPDLVTGDRHCTEPQQHKVGAPRGKFSALTRSYLNLLKLLHPLVSVYFARGVNFNSSSYRRTGTHDSHRHIARIGDHQVGGGIGLPGR